MTAVECNENEKETECEVCHGLNLPEQRMLECSLSELGVLADTCPFCRVIHSVAELKIGDEHLGQDQQIRVFDHSLPNFVRPDKTLILEIKAEGNIQHQLELYTPQGQEPIAHFQGPAERTAHPWPKSLRSRPFVPPATDGIKSIRQVREWIQICEQTHTLCATLEVPLLPPRVLEMFEIFPGIVNVRLVEHANTRAMYACLSHCWGQAQVCRTLHDNINQYKEAIPMASLSSVFSDAIRYAWALDLRYIWIDSLCIIQDDDKDWQFQSSIMSDIYANAALTLAASKASSGEQGMFVFNNNITLNFVSDNDPSDQCSLHVRDRIYHPGRRSNFTADRFPLLNRGWVYQERLLSKRVLHFGPQELFWECATSMKCQCTELDNASKAIGYNHPNFGVAIKTLHAYALVLGGRDVFFNGFPSNVLQEWSDLPTIPEYLPDRWRNMVTEYSALSLTRPSDRLPAFSGVAKQMQRYRGSKYLAGLWEDTFFKDLLWLPSPSDAGKRQALWQAPSWSWVSMACAIRWTGYERVNYDGDEAGPPLTLLIGGLGGTLETAGGTSQVLKGISCDLVEASCLPIGVDEHGAITSGSARIGGYLVCVTENVLATLSPGLRSTDGLELCVNSFNSSLFISDDIFWDDDGRQITCPHELYLLRIGCTKIGARYFEWSLLVRRLEDDMIFERCGIVSCLNEAFERENSKWFGHLESAATCTLV